jgi:hypothetical protein
MSTKSSIHCGETADGAIGFHVWDDFTDLEIDGELPVHFLLRGVDCASLIFVEGKVFVEFAVPREVARAMGVVQGYRQIMREALEALNARDFTGIPAVAAALQELDKS